MKKDQGKYSDKEEAQIKNSLAKLEQFNKLPNREKVPSASPLATSEVARMKGERDAFGRASSIIRANPEQIIAFQWDIMARHSQKQDTISKKIIERKTTIML